jgi:hypothetical protein
MSARTFVGRRRSVDSFPVVVEKIARDSKKSSNNGTLVINVSFHVLDEFLPFSRQNSRKVISNVIHLLQVYLRAIGDSSRLCLCIRKKGFRKKRR